MASRIVNFYKNNFTSIWFSLTTILLSVGVIFIKQQFLVTAVCAATLVLFAFIYYVLYFANYKKITDSSEDRVFYYKAYTCRNVFLFNVLFLFSFTLFLIAIDTIAPNLMFDGASFLAVLVFLSQ